MADYACTTRRALFGGALALSAAGALAVSPAASASDDQILAWDRQHALLWARMDGTEDEEEIARLCDEADVFDDLIREAPCKSRSAALVKLASLRRGTVGGERFAASSASELIDQIVAYLGAV